MKRTQNNVLTGEVVLQGSRLTAQVERRVARCCKEVHVGRYYVLTTVPSSRVCASENGSKGCRRRGLREIGRMPSPIMSGDPIHIFGTGQMLVTLIEQEWTQITPRQGKHPSCQDYENSDIVLDASLLLVGPWLFLAKVPRHAPNHAYAAYQPFALICSCGRPLSLVCC